jgi:hypothetical protein
MIRLRRQAAPAVRRGKRRRFRFSLNGLAIQLSAFALSFTLVALLVVSGSKAAFVEESEVLADYVPIGAPATPSGEGRRPSRPAVPAAPEVPAAEPPVVLVDEPLVADELPEPPEIQVELTDSDAGTAMFRNEILLPGVASERCIQVTYDGTDNPGPVLLYAAAGTGGDLAPFLDLTVQMGSAEPGVFGACGSFSAAESVFTGTLADFASAHASYATGRFTGNPSATQETRSFRFRVTVQDVPAASGKSATFGFTWRTEEA